MDVEKFPELSLKNKAALVGADGASCYFCLSVFNLEAIEEWTDDGETAKCPVCEVDSVLPGMYSREILAAGLERWFTGAVECTAPEWSPAREGAPP